MPSARPVTELLSAVRAGEEEAFEELLPIVYDQLHSLAGRQLRRERADHTLQPTALVHEAYLRLVGERDRIWENERHFLWIAATAMRRVLVHHAEKRRAAKRGGNNDRLPLDEAMLMYEERAQDLIALDESLDRLAAVDERKARIVELRFFGGLSLEDTARLLDVSSRTVEREWRVARAWLKSEIEEA